MTTRKPRLRLLSALLAVAMLMTLLPAGAVTAFAEESTSSVQLEIDPATGLPSEDCLNKATKKENTVGSTATTTYTGTGWEYETAIDLEDIYHRSDSTLTLTEGTFDFGSAAIQCDVDISDKVVVKDGTFKGYVQVYGGTITGGTFKDTVNLKNGTVLGGTFDGYLYIYASSEIQNGTFNAWVFVSYNNVETTISGGNFNKPSWGYDRITVDRGTVKITGGNFDREFVGSDDSFKISGGVFAREPDDAWIESGSYKTAVRINAVEATVNDTITGVSTVYTVGAQKLDIRTDTDYRWYQSTGVSAGITTSPKDTRTTTFTVDVPNKSGLDPVFYGVKYTDDALKLADDGYPEGSQGGEVSLSGDGWRYTSIYYKGSIRPSQSLELMDSKLAFDFTGKPVEYLVSLRNGATIQNGTFENTVTLLDGTIENGVFDTVHVVGAGEIKDGDFGYVYLNYSNQSTATISGGTFNGDDTWGLIRIHTGNLNITGGLFKAQLAEETYMSPTGTTTISGGTFLQNPTHTERELKIKGGVFANEPDGRDLIEGSTQYQVSLYMPEGGMATVNDGIAITEYGGFWVVGEQPITIKTNKAYHWLDEASGEVLSTNKTNDFTTTVKQAKTLKAVESIPVTVRFDANGYDQAPAEQTMEYGDTIESEPKLTAEGYTFEGWYNGDEKFVFGETKVTGDTTLTAKWSLNKYDVNFVVDGEPLTEQKQTVEHGKTATAPELTKTGYTFDGWYKDEACEGETFDFKTAIQENTTLYAKWNINSYTLAVDSSTESHDYGDKVKLDEPTKDGYTFAGWTVKTENVTPKKGDDGKWSFVMPAGDVTLTAKWTEVKNSDPTPGEDKPTTPEEPTKPGEEKPSTPETPETPSEPEKPSQPENPSTPEKPSEPEKPDTPSTPDKPSEPEKPDTPETPEQPSEPEEPKPVTYTIRIDNGKAYLDDGETEINTAEEGQKVVIKVNPEALTEGFAFDKWEIVSGEAVLADETAAETSFEMPASEVELKATIKAVEPAAVPLTGIEKAAAVGTGAVVVGAGVAAVGFAAYGIGTELVARLMLPAGMAMPTNRGELAVVLWKKAGSPAVPMEAPLSETEIALRWAADNQLAEPDAVPEERISAMDVIKALNAEKKLNK